MEHLWKAILIIALGIVQVIKMDDNCGTRFFDENNQQKRWNVLDQLKSSKRIVGGTESQQGSWPWQVALLLDNRQQCAGSLINENWIVTAAHCVLFPTNTMSTPEKWAAALGEHNLALTESFEQIVEIGQIISNPNFTLGFENGNVQYVDNDVALFKLKKPVTFSKYVRPICLLEEGMTFNPGKECYATGWGHTQWLGTQPDALREVKLTIVSHDVCNHEDSYKGHIHKVALCAGSPEGGVGTCQFDSGGPLNCDKNGRFYLTGVVSWGYECARPLKYDVFANMMALTSWVKQTIEENEQK